MGRTSQLTIRYNLNHHSATQTPSPLIFPLALADPNSMNYILNSQES